ncbi:S9 family peptidase [Microbacterium sp.]|uniref:S9 family peptidase n=1 Tax=Microbacterium sp. TaxID=51671 RepID=UPI003C774BF3
MTDDESTTPGAVPSPLPYGSWPSPLSAAWASTASPRVDGAAFVGGEIWWGQSVPAEAGRTAVFRRDAAGEVHPVLPAPWNARSGVHEYGGGSWAATGDGRLAFVERSDQQVWLMEPGGEPRALTTDAETRYGGLRFAGTRLLAIREREGAAPDRAIVEIDITGVAGGARELAGGSDFVAQPALSPDGRRLAWIAWDHPDMPWDRTRLRVGRLTDDGTVEDVVDVSIGGGAALQPEWASHDELAYLDDATGYWNPWRAELADGIRRTHLAPADADTGGALWSLGMRWYRLLDDGRMLAVRSHGTDELMLIERDGGAIRLDLPATASLAVEATDGSRSLVSGSAPGVSGIWLVDAATGTAHLLVGKPDSIGAEWMPRTRPATFEGSSGPVYAFVHPPRNPRVTAPEGERPPYLVLVHGGPTGRARGVADGGIVFFTSRGIGVMEVDYGGSTGYGRAYRERLRGQWGVVDVADVVAAAYGLADSGAADPSRLAIKGGSAGGWTVLSALTRADVFATGISRYGVGDARTLAADTHDFESRYLDGLIGPLPEAEDLYRERSPLTHIDDLDVPVLLLQGSEDAVVPPSQSEAIRDALAARGVPHAYLLYEGEGHGFRRADTIVHALESELAFLGQVFGFDTPGIRPITLD